MASLAYNRLDAHMWRLAWKWARVTHPNKPRRWIITRYFGMFNPSRNDTWVFGSRETGRYLRRFAWTKIVRHTLQATTRMLKHGAARHFGGHVRTLLYVR